MTSAYDYLTVTLGRGRSAWQDYAARMNTEGAAEIARAGGDLVGLFAPQLGFASNEAAILVCWPTGVRGLGSSLPGHGATLSGPVDALTPTLRPGEGQALRIGGIYVHRWFVVDGDQTERFIDLSGRAWGGFEGAYETEIFGLFAAAPSAEDIALGQARLLLLTWYASHGVWEASREQTIDPEGLFVRRHALTRSTIGRSSIWVPRQA